MTSAMPCVENDDDHANMPTFNCYDIADDDSDAVAHVMADEGVVVEGRKRKRAKEIAERVFNTIFPLYFK